MSSLKSAHSAEASRSESAVSAAWALRPSPRAASSAIAAFSSRMAASRASRWRVFSLKVLIAVGSAALPNFSAYPLASISASAGRALLSCRLIALTSPAMVDDCTTVARVRSAPICMPYSREHLDSSTWAASPATVITAARLALPDRDERSSCVKVDSRYGTYAACTASARVHLPRAERDVLMATACLAATPSAPVLRMRSEPARSANRSWRLLTDTAPALPPPPVCSVRCKWTKQCERDDLSLSRCPTAVRVSSMVRASRATSKALLSSTRRSPMVAKEISLSSALAGVAAAGAAARFPGFGGALPASRHALRTLASFSFWM